MLGHILPTALPDFVIGPCLGQGQMGVVYQAFQESLSREVAIKFLTHPTRMDRERFAREIEILGKVQHPNVVALLGSGESEGLPFIVMELMPGLQPFNLEWAAGRSEDVVLDRFAELLEALEALHAAGIIHRDLKPENLGIPQDGRLRVLDFGLARLLGQDHTLTQSGQVLGSLAYMSAEQLRDPRCADERSDLYSAGMVLREILGGGSAFEGMAWSEVVSAILSGRMPAGPKAIPEPLSRFVQRLVDTRPEERFSSAREARQELFAIRQGQLQATRVADAPSPQAPAEHPALEPKAVKSSSSRWAWASWTLVFTLLFSPLTAFLDWHLYDGWMASRAAGAAPAPFKLAMVEVDDESIAKLGRMPWPRGLWASVVERLAPARCVFLDVLFAEPSEASQDLLLASALKRAGNVILATSAQPLRSGSPFFRADQLLKPIDSLESSCSGLGHISVIRDRDGAVRTSLPYLTVGQENIPSMAETGARVLGLPPKKDKQVWLDFSRFSLESVPRWSASRLLEADVSEREAYFGGAVVLVTATFAGGVDVVATPLSPATPAGLIHLFALGGRGILILSGWPWAIVLAWLVARGSPRQPIPYSLRALAGVALVWIGSWLLFGQGVFLSPWPTTLALVCGAGVTAGSQWSKNLRARVLYHKTLERFVGPTVLAKLQESPDLRATPGQTRVTVVWGELSALTDLAEEAEAEEVVAILQRCHLPILAAIKQAKGSPCEMRGDGFVAFWPEGQAHSAVNCVIFLQKQMGDLIEEIHRGGFPRLSFSMGLASGPLIAGELGDASFSRYALVGKQMALAHQLALLAGRNEILMCPRTYELTQQMGYRALAQLPLSLRGFKERMMSWRLSPNSAGKPAIPAPGSER